MDIGIAVLVIRLELISFVNLSDATSEKAIEKPIEKFAYITFDDGLSQLTEHYIGGHSMTHEFQTLYAEEDERLGLIDKRIV